MKSRLLIVLVVKISMPISIWSINSSCYFLFIQEKSFFSFCLWHWFMNNWFVWNSNIIFRWFLSCFDFFQILVTWIWFEIMRLLRSWLEAKSFEVIKIWLCDCLKSSHETFVCWLFCCHFLGKGQSLRILLFMEIEMFKSFSPVMSLSYC